MVIRIALACKDVDYLERLVSGLEKFPNLDLTIFSDGENLRQNMRGRRFDVFAFSPDVFERDMDYMDIKADLKLLLDDEEHPITAIFADAKRVRKYQRISYIYKSLLDYYSEVCGRDGASGDRMAQIIAFYSPVGGAGKTTLALVAAEKFAHSGKRTFYISLEDMASEDCYLTQGDEKGFSDLMRYVDSNTNFGMKIQGMLKSKKDNFYYVNHFTSPNDIYDMNVEDMQGLLGAIRQTGLFDVIVVDMGTSLDKKNLALFEMADRVVVVERADEISARKMNCFYKMHHIMNESSTKMVRILNFDNGILHPIETKIPEIGRVGDVQNMDSANIISVLANSVKNEFMLSALMD